MSFGDKPLLVYLDSSDISVMSDPKFASQWDEVRRGLEQFRSQGDIRCVFSQAHLVEMAPTEIGKGSLAIAKADVLIELCGAHALPSLDNLMKGELKALRDGGPPTRDVLSTDGEWFPPIDDLFEAEGSAMLREAVTDVVSDFPMNRAQRRATKRLNKNGALTNELLRRLEGDSFENAASEMQKKYPMRDADAAMLVAYLRGKASREDATHAFCVGLRDPRWMMRWFASDGVDVTKFAGWLRASSTKMKVSVDLLAGLARQICALPKEAQAPAFERLMSIKPEWDRLPDQLAERLVQDLAKGDTSEPMAQIPAQRIHETCVGLSVLLRTFFSAAWASTSEQPRVPMASDLGDCFHAMYAPYVDVFRADSFMASHIQRQTTKFGTTVVPKLRGLLPAIEKRLQQPRATLLVSEPA